MNKLMTLAHEWVLQCPKDYGRQVKFRITDKTVEFTLYQFTGFKEWKFPRVISYLEVDINRTDVVQTHFDFAKAEMQKAVES